MINVIVETECTRFCIYMPRECC